MTVSVRAVFTGHDHRDRQTLRRLVVIAKAAAKVGQWKLNYAACHAHDELALRAQLWRRQP